jgi:hypothetical protein
LLSGRQARRGTIAEPGGCRVTKAQCLEQRGLDATVLSVGAFGKTEVGKDGSTFIIGARGGAFGADWESGIGVKVGPSGTEDVFWRTGPSVSAGAGPLGIDPNLAQTDISFVGAVDYIPTAFGFGGPAPPGC